MKKEDVKAIGEEIRDIIGIGDGVVYDTGHQPIGDLQPMRDKLVFACSLARERGGEAAWGWLEKDMFYHSPFPRACTIILGSGQREHYMVVDLKRVHQYFGIPFNRGRNLYVIRELTIDAIPTETLSLAGLRMRMISHPPTSWHNVPEEEIERVFQKIYNKASSSESLSDFNKKLMLCYPEHYHRVTGERLEFTQYSICDPRIIEAMIPILKSYNRATGELPILFVHECGRRVYLYAKEDETCYLPGDKSKRRVQECPLCGERFPELSKREIWEGSSVGPFELMVNKAGITLQAACIVSLGGAVIGGEGSSKYMQSILERANKGGIEIDCDLLTARTRSGCVSPIVATFSLETLLRGVNPSEWEESE